MGDLQPFLECCEIDGARLGGIVVIHAFDDAGNFLFEREEIDLVVFQRNLRLLLGAIGIVALGALARGADEFLGEVRIGGDPLAGREEAGGAGLFRGPAPKAGLPAS
jgi:hypothetical protein